MSEYIVDFGDCRSNQFVRLNMAQIEQNGAKLHEPIVRCRDCRHFKKGEEEQPVDWCCYFHDEVAPLGFCAWGSKMDFVTCKCGEDIERIGRIQTCPSCGRRLMA